MKTDHDYLKMEDVLSSQFDPYFKIHWIKECIFLQFQ